MRSIPFWLAFIIAIVSGFVLAAAFPSVNIWFFAIVGVAGLGMSLLGRNFWTGFLVGTAFGATFWLTLIHWLTLYLGPVPWLALGILQSLFVGISAGFLSLVLNKGHRLYESRWWQLVVIPLIAAAVWTSRELFSGMWPYGGFSWGKLAQSQSESPFAHIVAWVGIAGLSFIIAFVSFSVVQVIRTRYRPGFLIPFLVAVLVIAIPAFPVNTHGSFTVLAVQGNSKAGLFDNAPPGQVMSDHVAGTLNHEGEEMDLIVWPENAADIDPLRSVQSAAILTELYDRMEAPILTGAITRPEDDVYFNSSLLWTDSLQAQSDKIRPVPFAEYMPDRAFWRFFQPELVDLVSRDYSFGQRPNVININGIPMGISICFDITEDNQIRQMMADGGEVILAQTNNADFGKTSENVQQLAIARLRAIETARSVVNISTVGTSAIISPTGKTLDSLPAFESGEMLSEVPLSKVTTPAIFLGRTWEFITFGIALFGLLLILWKRKI